MRALKAALWATTLLLLPQRAAAAPRTELNYNGFQYRLANPGVTDIESVDYGGDDCPSLPCPTFDMPDQCAVSASVPPGEDGWSALYLATPQGLIPTLPWMRSYPGTAIVAADARGVRLTEAGWGARILLKCTIPCPRGTYLNGSDCLPCAVGAYGVNNTCLPCANAPLNAQYTSNGGLSGLCNFTCPANFFAQGKVTTTLLIGDGATLRGLDTATNAFTTLFTLPPGHAVQGFGAILPSTLDPRAVYVGRSSIHLANLTDQNSTRLVAGSGARGPSVDGVGAAAGFSVISAMRAWRGETFLVVVDASNCHLRTVDLRTLAVQTVAGGSACGFADGQGPAARFAYPTDVVLAPDDGTAYVADSGNFRVRAVDTATWAVTTLGGSGIGGTVNGVGLGAAVDPRYLALMGNHTLFVRSPGFVRRVDLATLAVTTVASMPYSGGIYPISLGGTLLYFTADFLVASLGTAFMYDTIPIVGAANARVAPFAALSPTSVAVLGNETLSATTSVCLRCMTCGPGTYRVCTATATMCMPCQAGTASVAGGCRVCSAGTYSAPDRSACIVCPLGTFSGQAATRCANCSAGTYPNPLLQSTCTPCPNGTYSVEGMSRCLPCAGLPPNALWSGGGVSEGNCTFACAGGYTLTPNGTACYPCGPGNWSVDGICSPCDAPPAHSAYVGTGVSPASCPYQCNPGYFRNDTARACVPCPAGTRMLPGTANCTNCSAGFYSGPGAVVCSTCGGGVYSLGSATACTQCPGANAYTVYVGRGTSAACGFACIRGSFVFNATVCMPCANGTFAPRLGATACQACAGGTWSGLAATACFGCIAP